MDLVTTATVKSLTRAFSDGTSDTQLDKLIDVVSPRIERRCNREFEYKARTPTFDVDEGQAVFPLRAFPAITITDVRYDPTHVFGSDTILEATRYVVNNELGLLVFEIPFSFPSPQALKVNYQGGLDASVTSVANLEAFAYDLAAAAAVQVFWEWKRIPAPGYTNESMAGKAVNYDLVEAESGLLREVVAQLSPYISNVMRY
jgi:hypothetical protein